MPIQQNSFCFTFFFYKTEEQISLLMASGQFGEKTKGGFVVDA